MCHHTDWKSCVGRVVWDDNLDLNPTYAQKDILVGINCTRIILYFDLYILICVVLF